MRICESCEMENHEEDEHCQMCDTWRSEQDDDPGPVLCECGTTTDLLHDCDAAEREQCDPPIEAGPRTDAERMPLEKAESLRSADQLVETDTAAAREGNGS